MSESDWKVVPCKSHRHRRRLCTPTFLQLDYIKPEDLGQRVRHAFFELIHSEFCVASLAALRAVLYESPVLSPTSIVCYGLGSPSCSPASIHQLAFLLIIRHFLASNCSLDTSCYQFSVTSAPPCFAFDPAFVASDVILLKRQWRGVIEAAGG